MSSTPQNKEELIKRMKAIRMILLDVDGVMTDGRIIFGGPGPVDRTDPKACSWDNIGQHLEFKSFDIKDGMAIGLANKAGLLTGILTGRISAAVHMRSMELKFTEVLQGQHDKIPAFKELLKRKNLNAEQIAYMGDDIQDLPVLMQVGLAVAPADARPDVRQRVHLVTDAKGGRGAVRELVEAILKAQGLWDKILYSYINVGKKQ